MPSTLEQEWRQFRCPVLTSPFRFEPWLSLPEGSVHFIDPSSFPMPASEHLRQSRVLDVCLVSAHLAFGIRNSSSWQNGNTKNICCELRAHVRPWRVAVSPLLTAAPSTPRHCELFRPPAWSLAYVSLGSSSLSLHQVLPIGRIHWVSCPMTTEGTLEICSTSINMCCGFLLWYCLC